MPTLQELLEQRAERLDAIPLKFEKEVVKTQKKLFSQIIASLEKLDKKGGVFVISVKNLSRVEEIISLMQRALDREDYQKAIKEFAKEFDEQGRINNDYFKKLERKFNPDAAAEAGLSAARDAVSTSLKDGAHSQLVAPVRQLLINSVANGAALTDTIEAIREIALDDPENLGKLHSYAKQISYDAFAQADGTYANNTAKKIGLMFYRYVGGLLTDSRDFCKARNNEYFHEKEIQWWPTKKASGTGSNPIPNGAKWQGRHKDTTPQTIFTFRGGYNCKHILAPVLAGAVPKAVLQRNVDNGNFEPTKKEKELYKLK